MKLTRRQFAVRCGTAVTSAALISSTAAGAYGAPSPGARAAAPPRVFLADGKTLFRVRDRIRAGDTAFDAPLADLRREAEKALGVAPHSVMEKAIVPPSGDKHDYLSQSIYWWPDPSKPDGLPYINKDGQINPETKKITDERYLYALTQAVRPLSLAYYFLGDEKYAAHIALLLRTWFLNPDTRMNPHLQYAQFTPGRNLGRYFGIVDTQDLVQIPDAIGLIAGYKGWTESDQKGMEAWMAAYCDWLTTSEFGKKEGAEKTNHGTVYDAQVVSLALFTGKTDLARTVLNEAKTKRIEALIEPDGTQPSEMRRTKGWTYSKKNLMNLFWLASMGDFAGVDLWNYRTSDGRSLKAALDYLIPFAGAESKPWPHKEINRRTGTPLVLPGSFLRRAAIRMREPEYERALARLDPHFDQGSDALAWPR
jgi:hypothetical protein